MMLLIELFPDPDLPINRTFFFFCFRGSDAGDAAGSSWIARFSIFGVQYVAFWKGCSRFGDVVAKIR
jgi:hypothetical protein